MSILGRVRIITKKNQLLELQSIPLPAETLDQDLEARHTTPQTYIPPQRFRIRT